MACQLQMPRCTTLGNDLAQNFAYNYICRNMLHKAVFILLYFLVYFYCIWRKKIQFSLKNCQSSKKYIIKWQPKRLPTYTMKVCQICAKLRYNGKKIPSFYMQNGPNLAFILALFWHSLWNQIQTFTFYKQ